MTIATLKYESVHLQVLSDYMVNITSQIDKNG